MNRMSQIFGLFKPIPKTRYMKEFKSIIFPDRSVQRCIVNFEQKDGFKDPTNGEINNIIFKTMIYPFYEHLYALDKIVTLDDTNKKKLLKSINNELKSRSFPITYTDVYSWKEPFGINHNYLLDRHLNEHLDKLV